MDLLGSSFWNGWLGSLDCGLVLLGAGGHVSLDFFHSISAFLGVYYLFLAGMNGVAALYLWQTNKTYTVFKVGGLPITNVLIWLGVSALFTILSPLAGSGNPSWMPGLPQVVRTLVNEGTGPIVYSVGTTLILVILFIGRAFFVRPAVAWTMFNASLLLMGLSMTDKNFSDIVSKPDNVPIVMLVYLLGFFTWLGTYQAVENDRRFEQGLPPKEKEGDEKVLVWPDLVYTEMICMIALTAFLIVWAILLQAPLEEPASSVKTPNPSKAPWYFLGLQEMLVYYDPWMAGVVLPSLIVAGLMAIPYIDFNKKGNGYYTIAERKFSYLIFQFGFLEMWITLIILGTFLRGPNWNFFGPFEYWDAHKVEALNNVNLSEYFWIKLLNQAPPRAPADAPWLTFASKILLRELPGILLLIGYFVVLPPVMAVTIFRKMYVKMGLLRFMVMANLMLFMAALPIKMVLRWSVNMKYIVAIPEWFLNF